MATSTFRTADRFLAACEAAESRAAGDAGKLATELRTMLLQEMTAADAASMPPEGTAEYWRAEYATACDLLTKSRDMASEARAQADAWKERAEQLQAAPARPLPKPLDDPHLQSIFMATITGAMSLGFADYDPPPAGHWLEPAWNIGREESRARKAAAARPLPTKDALVDIIAAGLRGTYHCTRVWSAWSYGTMGPDDFSPVDESDTPAELADAILAALAAPAPVAQPVGIMPRATVVLGSGAGYKEVRLQFAELEDAEQVRLWAASCGAQMGAAPAPVAMCHGCDMPQCRDAGRCAWVATSTAPVAQPEWTDAKLRGIASDYFADTREWSAAMLCMRHLLMEQSEAQPAAARVPLTPAQQHADELLKALQLAKNSLVAFKFMPGANNAWEGHDEDNLKAVDAAIEAAGQEGGAL